ncbi:MAG: hypothetical protein ACREIV_04580, partial [Planctomycetaceae bacterium]
MRSTVPLPLREPPRRSRSELWKRLVLAIGVAVVLVQWARLGVKPRGDFDLHWELGRRLVAGE